MNNNTKKITIGLCVVSTVFLGVSFFRWTIFPYLQMRTILKDQETYQNGDPQALAQSKAFYPMTFVQLELRNNLVARSLASYVHNGASGPDSTMLFETQKLAEVTAQGDQYPEHWFNLGRAYDLLSTLYPEKTAEYQTLALQAYEHALALVPGDQAFLYAYMINLADAGQIDKAIQTAQTALAEDPRVPESHYYLGTILYMKDYTGNAPQVFDELEFALSRDVDPIPALTKDIYEKMFPYYYRLGDVVRFKSVLQRLITLDKNQAPTYQKILDYVLAHNALPLIDLQ